jgi:hypothetical protein
MDTIIRRIESEINTLARVYRDAKEENVTVRLISDFTHAVLIFLDEEIRIKDLQQSKGLKEDAKELFKGEEVPEGIDGWPYLDQLEEQDRCFAAYGCEFKFGATMYKIESCNHFTCGEHQSEECLVCKKAKEKEKVPKEEDKQDKQDKDKDKKDKDKKDKDKKDKDKKDKDKKDKDKKDKDKKDKKDEQDKQDKKVRNPLFQVENIDNFSVDDFDEDKDAVVEEATLFLVRMRDGKRYWFSTKDYESIKLEFAKIKASQDGDSDTDITTKMKDNRKLETLHPAFRGAYIADRVSTDEEL